MKMCNKFIFVMSVQLYSGAGKIHERCKKIKPLNKAQRQRMYSTQERTHQTKSHTGEKKFSPFNTISRDSRTSYLLRVTKQPNTQTNYEINHSVNMKRDRRSTIDQASFTRIIGPVIDTDFSIQVPVERDHRCISAFKDGDRKKPLTVRETHSWRKKHEHLDFEKQINPERVNPIDFLKTMKSTQDTFLMNSLRETTQSNFNNYKRFSFKSRAEKSHSFNSNSGHQYLKQVQNREIEPEYDIMASKEQFFRQSLRSPKGQMRFNLNRQKIMTRKDRADPHWVQTIEYDKNYQSIDPKNNQTIDFDQTLNRRPNIVHSTYPIRQAMRPFVPMNK